MAEEEQDEEDEAVVAAVSAASAMAFHSLAICCRALIALLHETTLFTLCDAPLSFSQKLIRALLVC